jgi:hypothetical protein
LIAAGTCFVPLFFWQGGEGPGLDQDSDHTRDLNQPCRRFITNTKEESHGEEEKDQEESEVIEVVK